jgi:outer membrane protein OmpA-like peptidoglycan-associated protein
MGVLVFMAALGIAYYQGYRNLKLMKADILELRAQVNDATRLAQEESAAAAAASQKADRAEANAAVAAGARKQAEDQKQEAEAVRAEAVSNAQRAAEQAKQAQDQMTQMRREREEELNRMQEALNRVVETHRTAVGMTIVLPDSTFRFEFDSAELNQKNRELLSRIAGILLVSKGYGLSVFGYTDDVGTAEYNQQLSMRRAKTVQDYLIQSGIDAAIVNVKGFGKASPLVQGTSATARAKNRRVEIAVTDSSIRYTGESPGTRN